MIYYLLCPLLSILLIVLQNTIADVIFSGRVFLEVSIIAVIYTGFRFELVRGAISAFILGFVFDCISGSVTGLFTLIYLMVFLISFFMSARLAVEKYHLIAFFALFCDLFKEIIIVLFYRLTYNFEMLHNAPVFILLQALIVGLLAPVFFYLMRTVEAFFYDRPAQYAKRTGTSRIPEQT